MADSSFDVVSKVDHQEVDNALNQAAKELATRFDFKGTGARIAWSGQSVTIEASSPERATAALEVFREKLVRRGVSLKALQADDPRQSGKQHRIEASFLEGISAEVAKRLAKLVRDSGPRGVKVTISGDELRVSGKSRDDLQTVQRLLRESDPDVPLQFVNYR